MTIPIITAYIGRANVDTLDLEYKPEGSSSFITVPESTITRAQFAFGDWCLDTDNLLHSDMISLQDNATSLSLKIGLIDNLVEGKYTGYLTIFDATAETGFAWTKVTVKVLPWETCSSI